MKKEITICWSGCGEERSTTVSIAEGYEERADVRARAYTKLFQEFLLKHQDRTVREIPNFHIYEDIKPLLIIHK